MKINKYECVEATCFCGDITGIKRGEVMNWYWTPFNYSITYFLYGAKRNTTLEEELEGMLNSEFLLEYVLSVVKQQIEDSEDSDMFAEIYEDLMELY